MGNSNSRGQSQREIPLPVVQNPPLKHTTFGYCVICTERPAGVCAVPCGHIFGCNQCYEEVDGLCPICRKQSTQMIRVFNSSVNVESTEEESRKKLTDEVLALRLMVDDERELLESVRKTMQGFVNHVDKNTSEVKHVTNKISGNTNRVSDNTQQIASALKQIQHCVGRLENIQIDDSKIPNMTIKSADKVRKETSAKDSPLKSIETAKAKGKYQADWNYDKKNPRADWWIKTLKSAGYNVTYGVTNTYYNEFHPSKDWLSGNNWCKTLRISWI